MSFFQESERSTLCEALLEMGRADPRVIAGALVGSFAADEQDELSDLDISFGIKDDISPIVVLDEWTDSLDSKYDILHYFDISSSLAVYRVLLFSNGMEVDLSIVPESEYGPRSPHFKLLFGKANEQQKVPKPSMEKLYGLGWHHVLHANSAIHRGNLWQAEHWMSSLRNNIVAMKCLRLGLPSAHGRGADQLPENDRMSLEQTLITSLDTRELRRALNASAGILTREIAKANTSLAGNLSRIFARASGAAIK